MSAHLREDRLHDYVDDLLCREERAEVERHLVSCAHCQRDVARLRDMLASLASLPSGVAPDGDLLPGVHAGIAAASARTRRLRRAWLAAAVIALALAGTIGVLARGAEDPAAPANGVAGAEPTASPAPEPGERTPALPAAVQAVDRVEAPYVASAAELERLLARDRQMLRPETVRIIEESLAVVDRALAEARAALRDDPGNPVLEQILTANHQKKLDLLRGAARAGT